MKAKRALAVGILVATGCLATTKASDWAISPEFDFNKTYTVALVSEDGSSLDQTAYNQVSLQLLKVGNIKILERERVQDLLQEQEFGTTGAVDPSSAASIGKLTGADVIGVVSFTHNQNTLLIKLVEAETGQVLYMGQGMAADFSTAAQRALKPLLDQAASHKK